MKDQILADFIIECTIFEDRTTADELDKQIFEFVEILHVDDASYSQWSGAGLILTNSRVVTEFALWFAFDTFNNQAEYEVLLASLRMANKLRV